jgi:hypothetical protein
LSSTYSGIPHWTVNIFKLTQLLGQLKQIIDDPARKGPLSPVAIARAIIGQYQYETIDDIKKTLGKFGKSITKELQTLEQPSGSNGNGKGAPTKGPSR